MGLMDYLKNLLPSPKAKSFDDLVTAFLEETKRKKISYYSMRAKDADVTQQVLAMPDKEKVQFIIYMMNGMHEFFKGKSSYGSSDPGFEKTYIYRQYLDYLFKIKVRLDEEDVDSLTSAFISYKMYSHANITAWPVNPFLIQIGRNFDVASLPAGIQKILSAIKSEIEKLDSFSKDNAKILERIDDMLFKSAGTGAMKPTLFFGNDQLADYANSIITAMPEDDKLAFYTVLSHAQKASGGKPTNKYLEESKTIIKNTGADKFKKVVVDWLDFVSRMKEVVKTLTYNYGDGRTQEYNTYEFLASPNADMLKGIVWMCSQFHDSRTLQTIAALAERSFKKIPGLGPAAVSLGNACLYTLYKSKGLDGIAHLSRLKFKVKQNSTQTLIEKYLLDAARSEGVSVSEIEDLAADDYGLVSRREA